MPTQLEKTAAFLKKMAAEGSIMDKGLWGADAPFQQPAPALPDANIAKQMLDPRVEAQWSGTGKPANVVELRDRLRGGTATGTEDQKSIKAIANQARGGTLDTKALGVNTEGEAPGMLENYAAAMGRGHVGAVAGTAAAGAAALLAGVLTYNMLKKKKGGKITQMPGQRKVADDLDPDAPTSSERNAALKAEREAAKPKPSRMSRTMTGAKNFAKSKAGIATLATLGTGAAAGGTALALGGDDSSGADLSGGKTWAGKNLGVSTGSDAGDAVAGAGVAALGATALYQLYKKVRGAA